MQHILTVIFYEFVWSGIKILFFNGQQDVYRIIPHNHSWRCPLLPKVSRRKASVGGGQSGYGVLEGGRGVFSPPDEVPGQAQPPRQGPGLLPGLRQHLDQVPTGGRHGGLHGLSLQ